VIPVAIILGSLLGWVMAGRALSPVHDVARAAQRISSSNLSLRIPTRAMPATSWITSSSPSTA
jgi:HAMP domain-containing protein